MRGLHRFCPNCGPAGKAEADTHTDAPPAVGAVRGFACGSLSTVGAVAEILRDAFAAAGAEPLAAIDEFLALYHLPSSSGKGFLRPVEDRCANVKSQLGLEAIAFRSGQRCCSGFDQSAPSQMARRQRDATRFRSDWTRNQTTGLKTIHSMKMAIPGYLLLVNPAYSKE